MKKSKTGVNLQVKQDAFVGPKEGSEGPLNDPSNPLRFSVTNGKSGSTQTRSITSLGSGEPSDQGGK